MGFAHLHVHTEYSLLDGSNKIKEYVSRVKELGMRAAAITDHGVMYGVIDFYRAAKEAGINPIIGCEVYVAPTSRFVKDNSQSEDRYYHLVLLAENNKGYENLSKIVSKGFVDGFYYKPRVDYEVLEKYHEGIIALSACLAGEVSKNLARGLDEEAEKAALRYEEIFGKGNFFLELQDHGIPEQSLVNQKLISMSKKLGIELVATNDVHYTYPDDVEAHDILLCLQTNHKLQDENRMRYEGGQYYVKSPQEMEELFPYALQALENTEKIAKRCNVEIEFGVRKLPKYDVPEGYTSKEYLRKLCTEGLEKRYPADDGSMAKRLDYELSVIEGMGFVDYFLIVWDFINYAREHDIMVGPGRGSAAGSIVSYSLGITNIDPMRYNLLFERFLNPERVSMPDIDIDFCFERRHEVIEYVVRKYGKERVAQIVTFGTMAAKGAIRDVGRVLDYPYAYVDNIAKMIPNELNITIDWALQRNPELRKIYESDPQVTRLIDMAKRLEGLPRNTSMHAAGVVISQKAVEEYVPLSRASDGTITTQFTMTTIEELGLLKMDFLGLRTLTVIQNAVRFVKESQGIDIHIDHIDFDDKKVLEFIGTGKTEGVFQLESGGMKGFMKELKPESLEDIIAGISLYRPGPMDFIPKYIRGKNDSTSITYDCPQLEEILSPTYGCIVYQEQVMQIVRDLAGYTMGRSDLVRRAMSKKKASVMAKERQNFVYGNPEENVAGCVANGISEEIANKIYDEMTDFAKYAFNKSHAAAYAVVSYQTAYLKYYYPVEYMAALMTSVIDNTPKISEYIMNCKNMGIRILPPDINKGASGFSVSGKSIRFGLSAIKGVGSSVIEDIIKERELSGNFDSLQNFIDRMSVRGTVNKRVLEGFIKAGVFDELGCNRKQGLLVYEKLMDAANNEKKKTIAGQMSLFDFAPEEVKEDFKIQLPKVEEYPKEEMLAMEKEVLGVYVSGHPLEDYVELMARNATNQTVDFMINEETKEPSVTDGMTAVVGGLISDKTIKHTKNNQTMAFITLEDMVSAVEVVVFPRDYEKNAHLLTVDNKVFVKGRVSVEEEKGAKLICEKITAFADIPREVWIKFKTKEEYAIKEHILQDAIRTSDGKDTIVIYVEQERLVKRLAPNWNVCANNDLKTKLSTLFGDNNVKIVDKMK